MKVDRRSAIKASLITGIGMLASNRSFADCVTTTDIEGPYYLPNAKATSKLAPVNAQGTRLFITGSVYANDCKTPISNAVVDVWHANDAGAYEDSNYRGIIKTDEVGKYAYETILPGKYLNGALYRPRHLHYKVSAPKLKSDLLLTTQIYFKGDSSIPADPWASDKSAAERIIPLSSDQNDAEHGVVDLVLNIHPDLVLNLDNQPTTQQDSISTLYPNPVDHQGTVVLNLRANANVDLWVFALDGKEVNRVLSRTPLDAGRHEIPFVANNKRDLKLPSGVYVMKLFVNHVATDVIRFFVN